MGVRWATAWAACAALAVAVLALFIFSGLAATGSITGGQPLLPLDDAFIHLNYARSIADAQPYRYNPEDSPTSGATSLIYPYLLAPAVALAGARPLNAVWWALLLGGSAFATAGVGVGLLARALGAREGWGIAMLAFMATGLFGWHAASGMETMWVAAFSLLAVLAVAVRANRLGALAGALCALLRPEGAILAVLTSAALWLSAVNSPPPTRGIRLLPRRFQWRGELLLILLPLLAIAVQPAINWAFTGSWGSTGGSAKSLFGVVPFDVGYVAGRMAENFGRIWSGLFLGSAADSILSVGAFLAVVGWVVVLRRDRLTALVIVLWALLLTGAIATLDTAFWHFRRYQVPLFAVVYPLAGVGLFVVFRFLAVGRRLGRLVRPAVVAAVVIGALLSLVVYWDAYVTNIRAVAEQPLQLARNLAAYPDRGVTVAVHDVGVMRYLGGLRTLDLVGLTTAGAASWWRQGPGAVGEYLDAHRPTLIAAYGEGHGVGLGYLAQTDLYAEKLAEYTVAVGENNVALAAAVQGLYRPDYATADGSARMALGETVAVPLLSGARLVDEVDVADLDSERAHGYAWHNTGYLRGFATEWHQFVLAGCPACLSMDGARRLTGGETFAFSAEPGQDALLITRVHASEAGRLTVAIEEAGGLTHVGTRVIPAQRGQWIDVPTLIPGGYVSAQTRIRLTLSDGGIYEPSLHRLYQGLAVLPQPMDGATRVVYQHGAVALNAALPTAATGADGALELSIALSWWSDGQAVGDVKRFIHIASLEDTIVAQVDGYIGAGALPLGNLPPGGASEDVVLPLPSVAPGTYSVFVGLYDTATLERLPGNGLTVDDARRARIGAIIVEKLP